MRNLVLISQLAINVMVPIFLCLIAGLALDNRFGTYFTIPLLILGVLAGGWSAYRLAKDRIDKDRAEQERKEKEQREEWERRYGTGDGAGRNKRKSWNE